MRIPVAAPLELGRRAGLVYAGVGVLAAGAAVGLAAERYVGGRSLRGPDPLRDAGLGQVHGEVVPVVAADGTALHVEVQEPLPGAPEPLLTVVLCHGYALTSDSWHFQRLSLRGVARVVAWDQRGHGGSARGPLGATSIDVLGEDLLAVLDATAPTGPVVLVGHSMGGMTVMALAAAHPEMFGSRVVGVALLSTSPGRMAEVTLGAPAAVARAGRRALPWVLGSLSQRQALVDMGWRAGRDLAYVLTKRYSYASDVPPSLVEFSSRMIASTPIDVVAELYPAFATHDKLAALPVLHGVETLVMVGEQDLMTPADHSRAIVAAVPGAELVVVPDSGHLLMLEHPATVDGHLLALVARARRSVLG